MQDLLTALREYWQASEEGQHARNPVHVQEALEDSLANLETVIRESSASVTYDALQTVSAEKIVLVQLFQNLFSNAIKYRSQQAPQIHLRVAKISGEWLFTVTDNGLGIAPEHRETVFEIFKRLHRKKYPGVGMVWPCAARRSNA
jgi:chemotaxis family two-component system sensor kinase Cph1